MSKKTATLLLTTVSFAWGTSYIFMKMGIDNMSPFTIVAFRCGIAFILLSVIFFKKIYPINKKAILCSAVDGLLVFGIFSTVLFGLKGTTASAAGFLISTTVVMVPIIQAFITRKLPHKNIFLGIIVVMIGLYFMSVKSSFGFDIYAVLCLISALLYALQIIMTGRFVQKINPLQLGTFQLGFAALFALIALIFFETPTLPSTASDWIALLGLAAIGSAYGFTVQSLAQRYVSPEITGFIFSLEPVFSGILAFIFLDENIGIKGYIGSIIVLGGVIIATIDWKKIKRHTV